MPNNMYMEQSKTWYESITSYCIYVKTNVKLRKLNRLKIKQTPATWFICWLSNTCQPDSPVPVQVDVGVAPQWQHHTDGTAFTGKGQEISIKTALSWHQNHQTYCSSSIHECWYWYKDSLMPDGWMWCCCCYKSYCDFMFEVTQSCR